MAEHQSFYRTFLFFLFLSLALLFSFDISFSQTISASKVPVDITAEKMSYDKEEDKYLAEGDVVLINGGVKITAEVLTLERKNNTVTAMGDVIVTDVEGNIARGEILVIDLEKNIGEMNQGRLFFKSGNFHVEGEKIAKTGEKTYEIKKGKFTTCDCPIPDWSFSGSDVKITEGEFLVSRKNFFYIKDVPVLYSPYAVLPVNRKRQTGFLRPKVGFSDLRGIEFDNTFFWAIAENRDATFSLDYMHERGLGKGLEYRYITKRGSSGEIFFYHFKEKEGIDRVRKFRTEEDNAGHPQDAGDNRWFLRYEHYDTLPKDITVRVDINEISDDEYFLDFAIDSDERALQKLESNVAISKQWNQYNLVTQFRYYDDLLVEDDENTLQRLPEMTFTSSSQPLFGTPVYISSDSSYNYFYRDEGLKGHRADFHPKISVPFNPGGYFELTPQLGLRETIYWTNDENEDDYEYDNRNRYDFSLSLETTFLKIIDLENGSKVKHSIRPNVTYTSVPELDQTIFPSFDGKDRVAKESKVTYSLTSSLTNKWFEKENTSPSYWDTVFLEVSQSYDINEANRTGDEKRPFSDLKAEMILTPDDRVYFKSEGEYNVYSNQVSNYDLSMILKDQRGDKLDVGYSYNRNVANYLDLDINVNVFKGFDFFHSSRFSFLDADTKSLETTYGIDYQRQCWGIRLSRVEISAENVYYLTLNLLGLGEVGKVSAGFNK